MALSDVRKSDSSGEHAVYNSSVHSLIVELMSVRGIAEHGRVFGKLILNFNYEKSIRKSKKRSWLLCFANFNAGKDTIWPDALGIKHNIAGLRREAARTLRFQRVASLNFQIQLTRAISCCSSAARPSDTPSPRSQTGHCGQRDRWTR